jgi:hypothetical protein
MRSAHAEAVGSRGCHSDHPAEDEAMWDVRRREQLLKQAQQQLEVTCLGVALIERRLAHLKEDGLTWEEGLEALQRMQMRAEALRSECALQHQAVLAAHRPSNLN